VQIETALIDNETQKVGPAIKLPKTEVIYAGTLVAKNVQ